MAMWKMIIRQFNREGQCECSYDKSGTICQGQHVQAKNMRVIIKDVIGLIPRSNPQNDPCVNWHVIQSSGS